MNIRPNPNPDIVLRATAAALGTLLLTLAVANHEARDIAAPAKHITYTRTAGGLLLPPPSPLARAASAQVEAMIAAANMPPLLPVPMEPVENDAATASTPEGALPLYDALPPAK